MGLSRQESWSGLPCPPPGDLPNPGINPRDLTPCALAGKFFTASTTWKALCIYSYYKILACVVIHPRARPHSVVCIFPSTTPSQLVTAGLFSVSLLLFCEHSECFFKPFSLCWRTVDHQCAGFGCAADWLSFAHTCILFKFFPQLGCYRIFEKKKKKIYWL